jgi:hypothetical protein
MIARLSVGLEPHLQGIACTSCDLRDGQGDVHVGPITLKPRFHAPDRAADSVELGPWSTAVVGFRS